MSKHDFREFLFTGTGGEVDPRRMTLLDLVDLNAEMLRLSAIAGLMECADEASGELIKSSGAILSEILRRMRRILDLGFEANKSLPARARRRKQPRSKRKS